MTSIFSNKKAESTRLPFLTLIDIILVLAVASIFFSYGNYITKDYRVYQTVLARDISLLSDAMILSDYDAKVAYMPENVKFSEFNYRFTSHYTDVQSIERDNSENEEGIAQSYIRIKKNSIPSNSIDKKEPSKLVFTRQKDEFHISEDYNAIISNPQRDCPELKINKPKVFIQKEDSFAPFDDLFNQKYSDFISNSPNSEAYTQNNPGIHVYVKYLNTLNNIKIYAPFNDKDSAFACKLSNHLSQETDIDYKTVQDPFNIFTPEADSWVALYMHTKNTDKMFDYIGEIIDDQYVNP